MSSKKNLSEPSLRHLLSVAVDYHKTASNIWKGDLNVVKTQSYFARDYLRYNGIWVDDYSRKWPFFGIYSKTICGLLLFAIITLSAGCLYAINDFFRFADRFSMLIGVTMLTTKVIFYHARADQANAIFERVLRLQVEMNSQGGGEIRQIQRRYFLKEFLISTLFVILLVLLATAEILQNFYNDETYPVDMKLPFDLDNAEKHPNWFPVIYLYQVFILYYFHINLVNVETIGLHTIVDVSCLLEILVVRIRALNKHRGNHKALNDALRDCVDFHKELIALIEDLTDVYYLYFASQIIMSTLTICFSAFRLVFSLGQSRIVVLRAICHYMSVFFQVLYWCYGGHMMYHQSTLVAEAAYEVDEFWTFSPSMRFNLMFLMMRAQRPLKVHPKPLFPYIIQTFTSVIKMSYTYFTVMRDSVEK